MKFLLGFILGVFLISCTYSGRIASKFVYTQFVHCQFVDGGKYPHRYAGPNVINDLSVWLIDSWDINLYLYLCQFDPINYPITAPDRD